MTDIPDLSYGVPSLFLYIFWPQMLFSYIYTVNLASYSFFTLNIFLFGAAERSKFCFILFLGSQTVEYFPLQESEFMKVAPWHTYEEINHNWFCLSDVDATSQIFIYIRSCTSIQKLHIIWKCLVHLSKIHSSMSIHKSKSYNLYFVLK